MHPVPDVPPRADIAVFGGSGFYEFRPDATVTPVDTPYGPPSAAPVIAEVGGRRVAFLPRHGHSHELPAHCVNYRANVWAVAALRVRAVLAPFACGSLRPELDRGDLVFVDQLVDRTHSRAGTFHDGPTTHHQEFGEPYDHDLRGQLVTAARELGMRAHDAGTVVVIQGPRFSTRAESEWHRAMGWDVVNMTQAPEAALAAEAGLPYVGIGLVTDFDAGLVDDPLSTPVTQEEVMAYLASNAERVRDLLTFAIGGLRLSGD